MKRTFTNLTKIKFNMFPNIKDPNLNCSTKSNANLLSLISSIGIDNDDDSISSLVWDRLLKEAKIIAEKDNFMQNFIESAILQHSSFSSAISSLLADHFTTKHIKYEEWKQLFIDTYSHDMTYDDTNPNSIDDIGVLDLIAIYERDPASDNLVNPFLNFKGFKALQSHRIAHVLWKQGRKDTARLIQSRCSDIFAVDIHPAALIGSGLMIDHATGIVIGETSIVGTNCSFLHGVTLGSTGKDKGDRHPKIGNDVLIGCSSTILGNISIGNCCKIGSGSMVLKPIPAGSTAVGNPAKIVGRSLCTSASQSMDTGLKYVVDSRGISFYDSYNIYANSDDIIIPDKSF